MLKSKTLFFLAAMLGSMGCYTEDTLEDAAKIDTTKAVSQGDGCGTASMRTKALDATLSLIPKSSEIIVQRNCPLTKSGIHLATLTSIHYGGKEVGCPGSGCKPNLVCAVVDTYQTAPQEVTAVVGLFYAEWYAAPASAAWSKHCAGAFPVTATSTVPTCLPKGFSNPITKTAAFKALVSGDTARGLFDDCLKPYAGRFTE